MITGCYVIHPYCDARACVDPNARCDRMEPFTGDDVKDAYAKARAAGWRLVGDSAWCPEHADRPFERRAGDRTAKDDRDREERERRCRGISAP